MFVNFRAIKNLILLSIFFLPYLIYDFLIEKPKENMQSNSDKTINYLHINQQSKKTNKDRFLQSSDSPISDSNLLNYKGSNKFEFIYDKFLSLSFPFKAYCEMKCRFSKNITNRTNRFFKKMKNRFHRSLSGDTLLYCHGAY